MSVSLSEIQVARSEGGSTSLAGLKMQLDIKKSQSLSLLPQFKNQSFILSPSLLNQINESRLMSSRVISDYMNRVDEALAKVEPDKENNAASTNENSNTNDSQNEIKSSAEKDSVDLYA